MREDRRALEGKKRERGGRMVLRGGEEVGEEGIVGGEVLKKSVLRDRGGGCVSTLGVSS